MFVLHYHVIMAQCSRNDESCRSPHCCRPRRARAPRPRPRRQCMPLTLKTPPCLSNPGAPRAPIFTSRRSSRRATAPAPSSRCRPSTRPDDPSAACSRRAEAASPSAQLLRGPARPYRHVPDLRRHRTHSVQRTEQAVLWSCGPGRVDRPRLHGRAFTRAGRSWAGRLRQRACRGALHAPRRCDNRRALVASSQLRLPLFCTCANPFLQAAPTAALPRRQIFIRPLRPRSTLGLRRRRRR